MNSLARRARPGPGGGLGETQCGVVTEIFGPNLHRIRWHIIPDCLFRSAELYQYFTPIPDAIGQMLTVMSHNKYVILLLLNVILLIVGVFMDMSPAMLIFTPILFTEVTELGVHSIHFGIIIVYNLALGIITHPVGPVLFMSCSIPGRKLRASLLL